MLPVALAGVRVSKGERGRTEGDVFVVARARWAAVIRLGASGARTAWCIRVRCPRCAAAFGWPFHVDTRDARCVRCRAHLEIDALDAVLGRRVGTSSEGAEISAGDEAETFEGETMGYDSGIAWRAAARAERLVVVVGDAPSLVQAVRDAGWIAERAADMDEAYAMVRLVRPDAVVTKTSLPRGDGLSLTRALKGDARTRGIPVIAYGGTGDATTVLRALSAGCTAYRAEGCGAGAVVEALLRIFGEGERASA